MLDSLQKGAWKLSVRGSEDSRRVCLGDPRSLLQVEHGDRQCSRYVINDQPNDVRVSYKCGPSGHGVTTIRKETNSLVRIDTQGILNKAPFSSRIEARRVGTCN